MNALSTLGSYLPPQIVSPQALTQRLTNAGQHRAPSQFPTAQGSNDVALSDAGKAMARQTFGDASSLLQRAGDLGGATIEVAKKFVANFAESLFGEAAKGMSISFDTSSISASASFASILQHTEGSNGSSDAAAVWLEDASDFVGKGTITTADGHSFSFEVEVHYESTLAMAASSTSTTNGSRIDGNTGDHAARTRNAAPVQHQHSPAARREGLAAHFPGSVADLFKTLDQGTLDLSFQGQANSNDDAASKLGNLKLRLLDLLANPDALGQKLARAYGDFPSSGKVAEQV